MRRHTHLGAYGLALRGSEALLVLKSRGPYLGCWDLPGGRIEFGESPEGAVARELEEETGLHLAGVSQLIAAPSHRLVWYPEEGVCEELHHLGFIYRLTLKDEHQSLVILREQEDAAKVAWVPWGNCTVLPLTPFARASLQLVTAAAL